MPAREQLAAYLSLTLLSVAGCDAGARAPAPALSAETPVDVAPRAEPAPAPAPTGAGTDPRLPVLGDPLGLLSRPAAGGTAPRASAEPRASKLDPSSLMGSAPGARSAVNEPARDARAVERARAELAARAPAPAAAVRAPLQEKSAQEVVRRASQGGARVHVLLLYASYCRACRGVMPSFVQLARAYKARGVAFTAASIDGDREAFAAYAAVLEEALEPIWIVPDSGTKAALKRAGVKLPDDSLSIPMFAVFAGQNRVVAQGHSRELRELPGTLDALLKPSGG
jgi:thiol-disulfide isomerase/thioredoxin